jgi:hypothetical protein
MKGVDRIMLFNAGVQRMDENLLRELERTAGRRTRNAEYSYSGKKMYVHRPLVNSGLYLHGNLIC